MTRTPQIPNEQAWVFAAEMGEAIIKEKLGRRMAARATRGVNPLLNVAMVQGALVGVGRLLQEMTNPANPEAARINEAVAVAQLRAAIRTPDSWRPINEDGSPYVGEAGG